MCYIYTTSAAFPFSSISTTFVHTDTEILLFSWTIGPNWPWNGEVDILEQWNNVNWNQPAAHTGRSALNGTCTIAGPAKVLTPDCDNFNTVTQFKDQGCTVNDTNGPWGSPNGGVCKFFRLPYIKPPPSYYSYMVFC